jgi:hypothetical protein
MGEVPLYWFLPVTNSPGSGLAFPVSEDVRGILRGMRGNLGRMESAIGEEGEEESDEEEERVYRRDGDGRWMMHD